MISRKFVTAGKALFTLEIPAAFSTQHSLPSHYTYKVTKKEATDQYCESYFVSLLTGPSNESDYSYLGVLDPTSGEVRLTKASKMTYESMPVRLLQRIIRRLWIDQTEEITKAGFALHHEGVCCRCGHRLTVPSSIESGIGPECAKKV